MFFLARNFYVVEIKLSNKRFLWQGKDMYFELILMHFNDVYLKPTFFLKTYLLRLSLLGKQLVAHNNKAFRKGFKGIDPNNAN
jgi:hypothetical protein